MKFLFLELVTLILILCTFNSCKKDQDNSLVGQWVWIYSEGGIAVNKVTPSLNVSVTLKINADPTYATYINNTKSQDGTYSLSVNRNTTIIHFSSFTGVDKLYFIGDQSISLENAKLTLHDYNISDGYAHYFLRR